MKGSKRLLMLLLPALIVGAIVYVYFTSTTGTTGILTAKTTINAGMKIEETMLDTMQVPNTAIPSGAMTDVNDVIGKTAAVTRAPGDIIFRDALSEQEPVLKENETFIAVELPESLSAMIGEGNQINLVCLGNTAAAQQPITETQPTDQTAAPAEQPQENTNVIENLPVYSVITTTDSTGSNIKYAIIKTDKDTAVKAVNITAGEYAIVISK
ncbi:SAF domain protein [Mahella australiensis 50-1 BON]|uniref:SAF domain protein n=2 Tax=Mahella TaxID=252965 RepID=F3ZWV3_MAHA5|nr:SAF domain protein [Mahella australiensis 50-1 BON]